MRGLSGALRQLYRRQRLPHPGANIYLGPASANSILPRRISGTGPNSFLSSKKRLRKGVSFAEHRLHSRSIWGGATLACVKRSSSVSDSFAEERIPWKSEGRSVGSWVGAWKSGSESLTDNARRSNVNRSPGRHTRDQQAHFPWPDPLEIGSRSGRKASPSDRLSMVIGGPCYS